jgi:hypothetical protein
MRILSLASLLTIAVVISSCATLEQGYCQKFGVQPGTNEFAKCIAYYNRETGDFYNDYNICSLEADQTYPPSLYDEGSEEYIPTTCNRGGQCSGGDYIETGPNFHKNRQIDRLRNRIITPCMQAHGWRSGTNWESGRIKPIPRPGRVEPEIHSTTQVSPIDPPAPFSPPAFPQLPWLDDLNRMRRVME